MPFQPTIPTGTVPLNQDYANIQGNMQQLDTSFGINHVPFSILTNKGKHTYVQLPNTTLAAINASSGGPLVTGDETLYSKAVVQGELMFTRGNSGVEIQLTGPGTPVANTNGYTFLAGGLLLQWGQLTSTSSSFTTLTFSTANIAFPNNCYAVFTQMYGTGTPPSGNGNIEIRKSTLSKLSFDWCFVGSSSQYQGFFWWALGN